jgi:hypothetical protein
VTGTITVRRESEAGSERWTIAGVLAFASDEVWVPAMEVMSAIDLEIIGGCC